MKTNKREISFLERVGQYLVVAAIFGFAAAVVLSFIPSSINYSDGLASDGTLAAVSTVFLLMGSAFAMPGLLRENSKDEQSYSTMRFVVLAVVVVFAVVTVKIGWQTSSFEDFKIHSTWVYILGLAFGGKVAQTFTEDDHSNSSATDEEEDQPEKGEGKDK